TVPTESEFVNISVKMFLAQFVEGSIVAAFDQRDKRFCCITVLPFGVDVFLLGVIHYDVATFKLRSNSTVGNKIIRNDRGTLADVLANQGFQRKRVNLFDRSCEYLAIAFNKNLHRSLCGCSASAFALNARSVSRLSTDIAFIAFNRSAISSKQSFT